MVLVVIVNYEEVQAAMAKCFREPPEDFYSNRFETYLLALVA
jgi:hypothetical protein